MMMAAAMAGISTIGRKRLATPAKYHRKADRPEALALGTIT
jgi:hypothetical protein